MLRATVQRTRSTVGTPEASGEVSEPVNLGEVPSPRWLLEEVRAPGAARAEVDALLRGLALPLGPGETARERADLLHEIIEDEQVREYTGSGGRKVAHVAVLQLGELGFPYALEVPPELFAEARGYGRADSSVDDDSKGTAGRWLVGIAGTIEALPAFAIGISEWNSNSTRSAALSWLLAVALTSFVPAFLADAASVLRTRWLHFLLLLAMAVPALPYLFITVILLGLTANEGNLWAGLFSLLPLGMAALHLVGAKKLYGPSPDEPPPARDSD